MKVGTDAMVFGALIDAYGKTNSLDIGTGTGVLSLMLAQRNPNMHITALEINEDAAKDAAMNFERSDYANRISLQIEDFLLFKSKDKYDLIFSNPPFYDDKLLAKNESLNLAKHISSMSLELLLENVKTKLHRDGSFWLIWPSNQHTKLLDLVDTFNFHIRMQIQINGKPESPVRTILELVQFPTKTTSKSITIRDSDGNYSTEYKEFTKDFHNKTL
jgi:tRNA1Val (adenine37-N6)-methyltransferase